MDIRLLGPFEVVDSDGAPLKISGGLQRALLALLAYELPDPISADRVIDELWPAMELADPSASLQVVVSRLRSDIGRDQVALRSGSYALEVPAMTVDLHRFRRHVTEGRRLADLGRWIEAADRFRAALGQWRGDVLDGFEFRFAEDAARLLAEERLSAFEWYIQAEFALGNHALVLAELTRQTEMNPLREGLWHLLMLAQYRSGRQADALRSFGRARTILGEELGIEPSKDLVDLEERIILHDPSLTDPIPVAAREETPTPDTVEYSPGEMVVEEGSPIDSVYWVESGHVELFHTRPDGDEAIEELGAGRHFGELELLLGTPRLTSVRAVEPTTLSVHGVESLRRRLGAERVRPPVEAPRSSTLKELIKRGHYLRAYELATDHLDRGRLDPEIAYLSVLALARASSSEAARRRFQELGLDALDPSQLAPPLAEDMSALRARLDKDLALQAEDGQRQEWAKRSAVGYRQAFDRHGTAYLAVNASTMHLLSGDRDAATAAAGDALDSLDAEVTLPQHDYWRAVTEAEAGLVLGEVERAREALGRAALAAPDDYSARATTLRQLTLVCELTDIDPGILDPIRNPSVVHYTGNRVLSPGLRGQVDSDEEPRVASELALLLNQLDAGIGIGSLAAGADILVAEALLGRGGEIQVFLPFEREEFVATSVAPSGRGWIRRFDDCIRRAAGVSVTSRAPYLGDPILFDFCAQIAMGDALVRASLLETYAYQVAVWNGVEPDEPAGTSVDVRNWASAGRPTHVIELSESRSGEEGSPHGPRRQIRYVLLGRLDGFETLSDTEMIEFQETWMPVLGDAVEPHRSHVLDARSSGGAALTVWFDDVEAAASAALRLQQLFEDIDSARPGRREGRVALHAAPVMQGIDPFGGPLFYGNDVVGLEALMARVPAGEVYATHSFNALATLRASVRFESRYVGLVHGGPGNFRIPLYSLRPLSSWTASEG